MFSKRRKLTITELLAVLLALAAAFLLQGCGKTTKGVSDSGFPMKVTDVLGRQVTINEAPQRIVSLAPDITETLFALGLGDKVVGVTQYCNYPAEAKQKPKVGGFSTPSAELVVAAKPDLVLATSINKDNIPQLEQAGLKVIAVESPNLTQVLEKVRFIGKVTGSVEAANNLVSDMQGRIDRIAAKVSGLSDEQKPVVFFEIWPDPLTTGGAKSFISSLIDTAGGKNIAGDVEQDWFTISPEVVLARDPKVIIACYHGASTQTVEQLKLRKGWEQVAAIKDNRVGFIADENLVMRSGPRVVEGLELIAGIIHPELFK